MRMPSWEATHPNPDDGDDRPVEAAFERRVCLFADDPVERDVIRRYLTRKGAFVDDFDQIPDALDSSREAEVLVLRLSTLLGAVPVEMARQKRLALPILALADNAEVSIAAYRHGADIVVQIPTDLDLMCCVIDVLAARAAPRVTGRGESSAFDRA